VPVRHEYRVVADDHLEASEDVRAVGHTGAGHRVGHERHAPRSRVPDEANRVRGEVHAVVDDLHDHVVARQRCPGDAGLAVLPAINYVSGRGLDHVSGLNVHALQTASDATRDALVAMRAKQLGIPIASVMGGGYGDTQAVAARHAAVIRTLAQAFATPWFPLLQGGQHPGRGRYEI